jgi:hypothetical protein
MGGKKIHNQGFFQKNRSFVFDMMLDVAAVEEVVTVAEEAVTRGKRERPENRFGQSMEEGSVGSKDTFGPGGDGFCGGSRGLL